MKRKKKLALGVSEAMEPVLFQYDGFERFRRVWNLSMTDLRGLEECERTDNS